MERIFTIKENNENEMNSIRQELENEYNINIDEISSFFSNRRNETEYIRNPSLILCDFHYTISELIDKAKNYKEDYGNQYRFANYYSLTQQPIPVIPRIMPKEYTYDKTTQKVSISFKSKNKNMLPAVPVMFQNATEKRKLDHFIRDIQFNNNETYFSYYQADTLLHSRSFMLDILIDVWVNRRYLEPENYTLKLFDLNKLYPSPDPDNPIDFEKKLRKYMRNNTPPYRITVYKGHKDEIALKQSGIGFQIETIFNNNFFNIFNIDNPGRKQCTYQELKKLLNDHNSKFDNKLENSFIFEKTIGINLCIHIFYFLYEHIIATNTKDSLANVGEIESLCKQIITYPNTFSRVLLLDEILSVYSGNSDLKISSLISSVNDILSAYKNDYTYYYNILFKSFYYFLNKFVTNVEFEILINNLMASSLYSLWNFDPNSGIIESFPSRKVDNIFVTNKPQKDIASILYQQIQNSIISINLSK